MHPGAVWSVQSEPDLLIAGPGHCGQLCINCPQPFVCNGVQLAQCLHLETLAFLLSFDLLRGWLDLCVWAISLLMWSFLLSFPSGRHYAQRLFCDKERFVCHSSAAVD